MNLTQDRDSIRRIERERLIQEFNKIATSKQRVQMHILVQRIKRDTTKLEHLNRCKDQPALALKKRMLQAKLLAHGKKVDELLSQAVEQSRSQITL
ncbi:MAG TPA: hypothetical protein VFM68_02345 [Candidatus Saccharimonadales bacterium]|nr:hypothetical protein [Candidatus Saccharimonadales bacterium]